MKTKYLQMIKNCANIFSRSSQAKDIQDLRNNVELLTRIWNSGNWDELASYFTQSTIYIYTDILCGNENFIALLKEIYPNKTEMGNIRFMDVQIKWLSSQYALTYGKWSITSLLGPTVGGTFSWICEKEGEIWKIAMDHTTQVDELVK